MPSNASADVTAALSEHVASASYHALPDAAIQAAKTFILDSFGVALSGTRVPAMQVLHEIAATWGKGDAARVWGTGEAYPAASAAFLNGYQIHNQEWDCLHEPAVVHPMAVVLATLIAWAESVSRTRRVSGCELILGCTVAIDVAATLGSAAQNRLQFFRPAMCGALGATAGLATMHGLDARTTRSAMGSCYSQLSGTMQAHVEGSPVLPLQIGFNTRAALNAIELAARGILGPLNWLEGPFGYFTLIDPQWDKQPFTDLRLGQCVTELSHKPFPSGRASHGGADGVIELQRRHRFLSKNVAAVRIFAPPLVRQLVDRPPSADMAPSYARLCLPYVAATALLRGTVTVEDFEPAAIAQPSRQALAIRIRVCADANASHKALVPQRVEVDLTNGSQHAIDLPAVLGAPGRPLSRIQHLEKFSAAAQSGARAMSREQIDQLVEVVQQLEACDDVVQLVDRLMFVPA
ncbi:MAG: MmgE/PrpD family protein [Pseudomonadales bacterium]|nr:MmgE/PrpD family protein [Pseudomonadales bacterium]